MEKERKDLKVLIADDDENALKLLEAQLLKLGFANVIKAGGGREALTLAKEHLPGLIVLDIMMPDMDGALVKQHLNEDPETGGIPTVFVSSIVSEDEAKHMKRLAGGYLIIAKPYSLDKLSEAINEALGTT